MVRWAPSQLGSQEDPPGSWLTHTSLAGGSPALKATLRGWHLILGLLPEGEESPPSIQGDSSSQIGS